MDHQEALQLLDNPERLQQLAQQRRADFLPANQATYLIMRIVSYTNICVADCAYCAFYRRPNSPEGYVLTKAQIFQKVDQLLELGGSLVAMEGGFHPRLKLDHYEELFSAMRERYGDRVEIYGPTIVEVIFIAKSSRVTLEEALKRLWVAGLKWIPGGGAEILTDRWRGKLSPKKYRVQDYLDGMELAQQLGFGTTATMVIGFGESWEDRLEHLAHLKNLQEHQQAKGLSGFRSFLLWTYQSDNTALGGERIRNQEYLKAVALSRLYLESIPVIRASFLTQGVGGPEALQWGATDFDVVLEDQVTQCAGTTLETNIDLVLDRVKSLGITPCKRAPYSL